VDAIPFKGPTLAEAAYGDIALRPFSDLDVLVLARDFPAAAAAVAELGYAESKPRRAAEQRAIVANGYECAFDGPMGRYLLELQWRPLPRFYAVDIDLGDWFKRALPAKFGQRRVRCLAPEDLLLALCLHAAKHAWVNLLWLCDIAAVMHTLAVDYGVFYERAEGLGILRIVGVSFWLVSELLGIALPTMAQNRVHHDTETVAIGRTLLPTIAATAHFDAESPAYFRLMVRARERLGDRLRCLWRLAVTPGDGEWAVVKLPEMLFPLYRVVRLGRLLGRIAEGRLGH
jgi:hypothetical protein